MSDSSSQSLTHFDQAGQAHMVDIADKAETQRMARAIGQITMLPGTLELIANGSARKGDVLGVARIAAIQASKRTAELIPLCHLLLLSKVEVEFQIDTECNLVQCIATVATFGRTGVEMEAITTVSVALLTIYDMCKAVDRSMRITQMYLLEKQGGRSGHWKQTDAEGRSV